MFLRRILPFALLILSILGLCHAARGQGLAFDLEPGTRVLPPILFKQLALFPVVRAAAMPLSDGKVRYLTLGEGLKQKTVIVTEDKGGAQVNRVHVANNSERPLLLLGGEIILGGQQDRILGKDTILPAHEEMALEVFCVEHGRWSGNREFTRSGGMVEGRTKLRAKYHGDQGEVWAQVAKKTEALKATSSTGTYRALATGPEGERALKPYRDAFSGELRKLPDASRMVGVIAAVNGRVTSVEVFADPNLFAAYRDQLLDSIFVAAADVPLQPRAHEATSIDVKQFMDRAEAAPAEEVAGNKAAHTVQKKGGGVVNSTVSPSAPSAKPVYRSYQAEE